MRPEEEATLVLLVISVSNPFLLVNMVDFPSWGHDPNYCWQIWSNTYIHNYIHIILLCIIYYIYIYTYIHTWHYLMLRYITVQYSIIHHITLQYSTLDITVHCITYIYIYVLYRMNIICYIYKHIPNILQDAWNHQEDWTVGASLSPRPGGCAREGATCGCKAYHWQLQKAVEAWNHGCVWFKSI